MRTDETAMMNPQWAKDLLVKNSSNRPVRGNVVKKYVAAMQAGEWKRTHQGIALAPDGTLLDGQHRLFAVQKSGCTVPMNVSYDCDPEIFTLLDCGVGRSAKDALKVMGVSNSDVISTGTKIYILNSRYPARTWSALAFPTHQEIKDTYVCRKDTMDDAATKVASAHKEFNFLNKGALLSLILMLDDKNEDLETIYKFVAKLSTGEGVSQGTTIYAYRKALYERHLMGGRNTVLQQKHLACLIKCWNYSVLGTPLKVFKAPDFPPMPQLIDKQLF
jgi:hypothetical protein|tara:strand:- start:75 stop:899 length:825 start_codon:yes stop_codon:yes gene_type:complete